MCNLKNVAYFFAKIFAVTQVDTNPLLLCIQKQEV